MAEEPTAGQPTEAALETGSIDNLTRAAVFTQIIGKDAAAELFSHLDPREVQRLAAAIKDLDAVPQAQVEQILGEFMENVGAHSNLGMDSESYVRSVLEQALPPDIAAAMIDRITVGGESEGLEHMKWMDARQIVEIIRDEHPQVKAIVLSSLEPDHAASVLALLPERTRPDIVLRIATLDSVQPEALMELNRTLETQVSGTRAVQTAAMGGLKRAADVLNFVDSSAEAEIMEFMKEHDADLGQQIEDLMFVFENLRDVDAGGIQTLLREVSSDSLLLALKGADDDLKEYFFSNMSKRAAEMLRDDLEAKGPVRISEVEVAQKEILTIARRLAEEGQIALGGAGGEEYI